MSIPDLLQHGEFLLGPRALADQSDWLQSLLTSVSPLASFMSLGHGASLVLLQAKFSAGAKQFVPVFKVRLTITDVLFQRI